MVFVNDSQSSAAVQIHPFYTQPGMRLHICPGAKKHPIADRYPDSELYAADVQKMLDTTGGQRYCWMLGPEHLILDVDMHYGGADGMESLNRLQEDIGVNLFDVCKAILRTPTGGMHFCFSKPVDFRIKSLIAIDRDRYAAIDTLSRSIRNNALVIGANSTHPSAIDLYRWEQESPELVAAPKELLDLISDDGPVYEFDPASMDRYDGQPGDQFMKSWAGVELLASMLSERGYTFYLTGDEDTGAKHYEFRRPDKTTGSRISGYLGKLSGNGNFQLTSFSHSDDVFPAGTSITITEALVRLQADGKVETDDEHSDAWKDTIRWLSARGWGQPRSLAMFDEAGMPLPPPRLANHGIAEGGSAYPYELEEIFDQLGPKSQFPVKSVGSFLVRPTRQGGVHVYKNADEFFASMRFSRTVQWVSKSGSFVSKSEFYHAMRYWCESYDMISSTPHYPRLDNVLYMTDLDGEEGQEEQFWQFVDQFNWASPEDRLLGAAAILTPFWGVLGGHKPMMAITSPDMQGAGKSTLVSAIARLCGVGKQSKTTILSDADYTRIGEKLAQLSPLNPKAPRMIVLDNYKGVALSKADIEAYLTEDELTCRRLYHGDLQLPNWFTWFITGNSMSLSEDLAQRTVEIVIRKPGQFSGDWTRRMSNWPVEKVLQGIAAVMKRPAEGFMRGMVGDFRFASWAEEVLGRVMPDAVTAHACMDRIRGTADSLSIESEDALEMRRLVGTYVLQLSQTGAPIIHGGYLIQATEMCQWINAKPQPERTPAGKRWTYAYLGRKIKTHMKAFPELTEYRTKHCRGYLWDASRLPE